MMERHVLLLHVPYFRVLLLLFMMERRVLLLQVPCALVFLLLSMTELTRSRTTGLRFPFYSSSWDWWGESFSYCRSRCSGEAEQCPKTNKKHAKKCRGWKTLCCRATKMYEEWPCVKNRQTTLDADAHQDAQDGKAHAS